MSLWRGGGGGAGPVGLPFIAPPGPFSHPRGKSSTSFRATSPAGARGSPRINPPRGGGALALRRDGRARGEGGGGGGGAGRRGPPQRGGEGERLRVYSVDGGGRQKGHAAGGKEGTNGPQPGETTWHQSTGRTSKLLLDD